MQPPSMSRLRWLQSRELRDDEEEEGIVFMTAHLRRSPWGVLVVFEGLLLLVELGVWVVGIREW